MRAMYNESLVPSRAAVMSTDLSKFDNAKKHYETVEKCWEYNKGLKDPMISKSVELTEKLGRELQFSEKSIQGSIQLAQSPDLATPAIANWTFGSINMLIQEVGSNVDPVCRLSLAFPDKPIPYDKSMIDRIAGNTGILPEFGGDNAILPTVRPLDTYGLTYMTALFAGRTMLNAREIMYARERGKSTFGDRGIGQLVAYNSVNLLTQAMTRKKYMLNQAIFFNGYTFAGETVSSNIPAENYIQLYQPMGTLNANGSVTYSSSDPLYNPLIAITNILGNPVFLKYRQLIKGIILNGQDLMAIMDHPNVQTATQAFLTANGSLNSRNMEVKIGDQVQTITGYYAPGFNIPLIADDGVWQSQNADGKGATTPNNAQLAQGAQNFFVPRGRMYVLLDLTAQGGQSGAFHLTYNEVDPNIEAPAMGLYTGVFNRNLENSDVTNRLDLVAALSGAPAVYMPEAQFILTGLYENIS